MAENFDEPFYKSFRDSIESLSEMPEKHVWENIEQQLDKDNSDKYKRKYIFYKKIAGILFFLLIGFVTYVVINNQKFYRINLPSFSSSNKNATNNYSSVFNFKNYIKDAKVSEESYNNSSLIQSINKDQKISNKVLSSGNQSFLAKNTDVVIKDVELTTGINYNKLIRHESLLEPDAFKLINLQENSLQKINFKNPFLKNLLPKNNNEAKRNHLFISVFAAPEYANYTLEDNDVSQYENKQVIQKRETHLLSFSAGVLFNYESSKKISIQSGITYSSSNININPGEIYAEKDNSGDIKYRYNTSSGYGYILPSFSASPSIGDSLFTRTSVHNLQFITVPFIVHYKLINNKVSFNPGAGVSMNFLTAAGLTTEVKDFNNEEIEVITNLYGIKKIYFSFLLTSDLQYRLSEKWFLTATPYFKYALSAINKQNIVKTYPYNIGFGLGVKYQLD